MKRPTVVDLFCGCGGLSEGFRQAGFEVIASNDSWSKAVETYKKNHGIEPILGSISDPDVYEKLAETARGADVVIGGPPCQAFSTAGRRLSVKDPRGNLILEFIRFIDDIKPKSFVMENVRGILSAAIKHRPTHLRDNGKPLSKEERLGSALDFIMRQFSTTGYTVSFGTLNAADYGAPQKRERVFFMGARNGFIIPMPKRTHSKEPVGGLKRWVTLGEALEGLDEQNPEYPAYSQGRANVFGMVPPGEYWRSLPKHMHMQVLGGAYGTDGGRTGFYRRLSFNQPAPTLVTSPAQKGTGMCHPTETRPLTVKEYARVQQFPDEWEYAGSMADKYKMIGNAVPVGLARAVAETVKSYLIRTPNHHYGWEKSGRRSGDVRGFFGQEVRKPEGNNAGLLRPQPFPVAADEQDVGDNGR